MLSTVLDTYQPVTLLLLPMYHIFATQVAMRMFRACHKFVIMPQFTADNLLRALEKYKVFLIWYILNQGIFCLHRKAKLDFHTHFNYIAYVYTHGSTVGIVMRKRPKIYYSTFAIFEIRWSWSCSSWGYCY